MKKNKVSYYNNCIICIIVVVIILCIMGNVKMCVKICHFDNSIKSNPEKNPQKKSYEKGA